MKRLMGILLRATVVVVAACNTPNTSEPSETVPDLSSEPSMAPSESPSTEPSASPSP
jgi:hypothetical protein